jgi:hypothetical protein
MKKRHAFRVFVVKPEGQEPLGRLSHRWVDNIMMDLGDTEWGGAEWIGLTQDTEK